MNMAPLLRLEPAKSLLTVGWVHSSILGFAFAALLLGGPGAHADGTNRMREVYFREGGGVGRYRLASAPVNATNPTAAAGISAAPSSRWTLAYRGDATQALELGDRLVLRLAPGTDLSALLRKHENHALSVSSVIRSNLFVLQAVDSEAAIVASASLSNERGVLTSHPVMRRPYKAHDVLAPTPNDTYFRKQWHLENRGADGNLIGPDLNARAAWSSTMGQGVLVAVVDMGFQLDHPELVNRAAGAPHFNFFKGTSSGAPYSSTASHATAVAGLVAAESGNSRGVAGVAPQAGLASWVIFGVSSLSGGETVASDEQLMQMFAYASNRVAVQNHSWGSVSTEQTALGDLEDAGIENAVRFGRGGKGVVMVRAGGNDRESSINVNDDGLANDPRAVAVAAVRLDGRACSYSDQGACLLVGAPSGDTLDTNGDGYPDAVDPTAPDVYTTDRTGNLGYTTGTGDASSYTGFNGTSASSPQVAGVAALILSANTNLSYRDVQQILVQSARHYDLADPDVRTNGAGFLFSHNVGFGVPDAGFAVKLAKTWPTRPASERVTLTNTTTLTIPDDSLRLVCVGTALGESLGSIHCLPSEGPHPDDAMGAIPMVYVGFATTDLDQDLHGKAALIQRGGSFFYEKIQRAAKAGAAIAVIYNNTGTTEIQGMGATGYVPIPAVSIGRSDGETLRVYLASAGATASARLQLVPAITRFDVTNTLVCEHVGVRLKTTHTSRSDVRVTLVSPMGTRSVLQTINQDNSAGPVDWTYWSTQHFYECSAGQWRLEVSDERNTVVRSGTTTIAATGSQTYAELILDGVSIVDTDRDGLDDNWERAHFGALSQGPKDDPDGDGFCNAREQAMGTDPSVSDRPFKLDLAVFKTGYWRLSWPGVNNAAYRVLSGGSLGDVRKGTAQPQQGTFPTTEIVIPASGATGFFDVRREDSTP